MTQAIPPPPPLPTPQPPSSLSFSQGFLLGQLSILLLLGAFLKFFLFSDAPSPTPSPATLRRTSAAHKDRSRSRSTTPHSPATLPPPTTTTTTTTLLTKTAYNPATHPPEPLDWFTVLAAQAITHLRTEASAHSAARTALAAALNGPARPAFLDEIRVTELCLGEDFPRFRACRVELVDDDDDAQGGGGGEGRLQARMDVELGDDGVGLGVETKVVLNYPRLRAAVLPVALAVAVVRFRGTLAVSFLPLPPPPPPPSSTPASAEDGAVDEGVLAPTTLSFAFLPDYELELSTRSLVGSRSRLQDVPKIAQIVESRLRAWFEERCMLPRVQVVVLPSLWPRKSKVGTRVASGGVDVGGGRDGDGVTGDGEREGEGEGEGLGREKGGGLGAGEG